MRDNIIYHIYLKLSRLLDHTDRFGSLSTLSLLFTTISFSCLLFSLLLHRLVRRYSVGIYLIIPRDRYRKYV